MQNVTPTQAKAAAMKVIEKGLDLAFEKGVYNMSDAKQIIAAVDVLKQLPVTTPMDINQEGV